MILKNDFFKKYAKINKMSKYSQCQLKYGNGVNIVSLSHFSIVALYLLIYSFRHLFIINCPLTT